MARKKEGRGGKMREEAGKIGKRRGKEGEEGEEPVTSAVTGSLCKKDL